VKIREVMIRDPVCCVLSDSAQAVAKSCAIATSGPCPWWRVTNRGNLSA
jgi:hypothetical protein